MSPAESEFGMTPREDLPEGIRLALAAARLALTQPRARKTEDKK